MILSSHELGDLAVEFGSELRFVERAGETFMVTPDEVYRVERGRHRLRLYPVEGDRAQAVLGAHEVSVHR